MSRWKTDQQEFLSMDSSTLKIGEPYVRLPRRTITPALRSQTFDVEIFSAPKPFLGPDKEVNLRAIRSWQRLKPIPTITLLGHEIGYEEVCRDYNLKMHPHIDKTFLGIPLFNSMFHIANNSQATVAVIINGDIVLTQDFILTLTRVLSRFKDFLMISARYDVEHLPEDVIEGRDDFDSKLLQFALNHGVLHTYGGMDLWAWNTNGPRLFDSEMPHFIFGRGKYDNWLTHETISAGRRHVIDASEAVMSIHIRHDYNLVSKGSHEGGEGMFWSQGKKSKFELFTNIYLSQSIGTYSNQLGSILFAPWRFSRCLEPEGSCLVRRVRPGICNCEYAPSSIATQTDPVLVAGSRVIRCGTISNDVKEEYEIPVASKGNEKEPSSFGMPLMLNSLAEKLAEDNTIIVTALNYGYREMMMNWVCNLRHLNITNFLVAAFDEDLYKYAYVRGVGVYLENTVMDIHNASLGAAAYGSDSFKDITKMKSRVVLRFLKLGYNTIWSDTDIIWFKNPIDHLKSHEKDIVIQSNAPDKEEANGKRRINSGFYLAMGNQRVVKIFEEVIKYASKSRMSEQPCFYDVICGKSGERRVGRDGCSYKGLELVLLDRLLYPNGLTQNIWDTAAGKIRKKYPMLYILHNNWVKGSKAKEERLRKHGFVMHDNDVGLCTYGSSVFGTI